jgi:threonyl-tRNA synthetase
MLDAHDHRQIGKNQNLFHFQDEAPGMAFWHPRGALLCRLLEDAARAELARQGYLEVRSPHVMRQSIWEASGHWEHFAEGMFKLEEDDGRAAALRPVNCPGHAQIFACRPRSHHELPVRLAEFGVVHRKEPSGALQGLFRLRQFSQDDGHLFCKPEQVRAELLRFCRGLEAFYRSFGFAELSVGLSLRPAQRLGSDAVWDAAERALESAARELALPLSIQPSEGAFYGPKLEFKLQDRLGRVWQCGTIQADFVMPERFDLAYVDAAGQRCRPAMLHRALYGSVERFLGVLLEQHAGRLPAWLAPEQVRILPVGDVSADYVAELLRRLQAAGLRAAVDASGERLAARVAAAEQAAVPFMVCVGPREAKANQLNLRAAGQSESYDVERALGELVARCAAPS